MHEVVKAFSAAGDRLAHPRLQLATVGTTSAGKSTLLNGLMGRRLCPMDNQEMSAGLLTITQATAWNLQIKNGPAPSFAEATEEGVYALLHERMRLAVHARKERREDATRADAPPFAEYRVRAPLFPGQPSHVFQQSVGEDIGLTLFDLPGLRKVDDLENLEIIQRQVRRSFSLVTINYTALHSREERHELLKEVRETVQNLRTPLSLVIFVLNRVDERTSEDHPLQSQLDTLQIEIQRFLGSETPIQVLPFCALAYMHGARLLLGLDEGQIDRVQGWRKDMLDDTLSLVMRTIKARLAQEHITDQAVQQAWRPYKSKLRDLEDDRDDKIPSDPDLLRFYGETLLEASGHERLWQEIMKRLETHLPSIVILPEVRPAMALLDSAQRDFQGFIHGRIASTELEVARLEQELSRLQRGFETGLQQKKGEYKRSIDRLIAITNKDKIAPSELLEVMKNLGVDQREQPELAQVYAILGNLIADLEVNFLDKLRKLMENHALSSEFSELLKGQPGEQHALALTNAWERMTRVGYSPEIARNGMHEDKKKNEVGFAEYKALQKYMGIFFLACRRIMTSRAETFLRREGGLLGKQVGEVVNNYARRTWKHLRSELSQTEQVYLQHMELGAVALPSAADLRLPKDVLSIPEPKLSARHSHREITHYEKEDPDASCFEGDDIAVEGDVEYIKLDIPSAKQITNLMTIGIRTEKSKFWSRFARWLETQLKASMTHLEGIAKNYTQNAHAGLNARRAEIRSEGNEKIESWNSVSNRLMEISETERKLGVLAGFAETG